MTHHLPQPDRTRSPSTPTNGALTSVWMEDDRPARATAATRRPLDDARRQLEAYFAGELREFDLPLAPEGIGVPAARVERAVARSPTARRSATASWPAGWATRRTARAVGAANGRNPLPVIVPCHRVIGADGSLTGFGGGLDRKRRLLELEAGVASLTPSLSRRRRSSARSISSRCTERVPPVRRSHEPSGRRSQAKVSSAKQRSSVSSSSCAQGRLLDRA